MKLAIENIDHSRKRAKEACVFTGMRERNVIKINSFCAIFVLFDRSMEIPHGRFILERPDTCPTFSFLSLLLIPVTTNLK